LNPGSRTLDQRHRRGTPFQCDLPGSHFSFVELAYALLVDEI
jgi:hypothetical protein